MQCPSRSIDWHFVVTNSLGIHIHIHWPTLFVGIYRVHESFNLSYPYLFPTVIQCFVTFDTMASMSQFFVAYRVTDNKQIYVHFTCAALRSPRACREKNSSSTISVQCNVITYVARCHSSAVSAKNSSIEKAPENMWIQNINDGVGVSFLYWNEKEWHDKIYVYVGRIKAEGRRT